MKLLFYINILSGGGAERVVANLSNLFAADDHQVILVTTFATPDEYEVSKNVKRINLESIPDESGNRIIKNIRRIGALRRVIREERPDVVISFMEEPNFRAVLAARHLRVKTVVSVRNDPAKEYAGKIGGWIAQRILPQADGCVFQTKDAQAFFPMKLQKKSRIIPNAVKEEYYLTKRTPTAGKVVTFGRLTQQKNHKMLIEAFGLAAKEYPYAVLEIYGAGELENELNERICSLHLEKQVYLKGHVGNVAQLLSTADVFVLSSDYEGMPNALMEAMASGVPCISTDCPCGGPRMLIENGKDGLLVPVGGVEEMKNALVSLLEDRALKDRLGDCARKKAAGFKPDVIYRAWKNYLEEL